MPDGLDPAGLLRQAARDLARVHSLRQADVPDGVPVMVTPANVRRLVNPLVLRLWNTVSGVDVGDATKN